MSKGNNPDRSNESGNEWREYRERKRSAGAMVRQKAQEDLTVFCAKHNITLTVIQPWQLRLELIGRQVDVFPSAKRFHDITGYSRGSYKDLLKWLQAYFNIPCAAPEQSDYSAPPAEWAGFMGWHQWVQTRNNIVPNNETVFLSTIKEKSLSRFMILTDPASNNFTQMIIDLKLKAIGKVWFYKSVEEILGDKKGIFAHDRLEHVVVPVPGYTITIMMLAEYNGNGSLTPIWWNGAASICADMALWYAKVVADPQSSGRFKRYKFV